MIKAVLFDYGGVLSKGGRSVKQDIADFLGVPADQLDFDELNDKFRRNKITSAEFFGTLNEKYGGDGSLEQKLMDFDIFYQKETAVYELAEKLRTQGIKTAIFSNVYQPSADRLRARGLYDGFDPVILSCEEGYAKPDTEFYQLAFDRLGVIPEETLLIDDQDKCLIPAQKLGMKTIKSITSDQVVKDTTELFTKENNITL